MAKSSAGEPSLNYSFGVLLLLVVVAAANSLVLYYVAWPQYHPRETYGVVLIAVSGLAHILYLAMPWFVPAV